MAIATEQPDASGANIDTDGYRANVGMIICDTRGHVFWARRVGQSGWQFPQGGIQANELPMDAMYRELLEEVGLHKSQVEVLGQTADWLKYKLPLRFRRRNTDVECIGQKQLWFLLRYTGSANKINFDATDTPEFEDWRWVDYWYPVNHVIYFKRNVYKRALNELQGLLQSIK